MHTKTSVLLIGSGRLAKHLQYWNGLLTEPNSLIAWNRSQNIQTLQSLAAEAEVVWLALSDSALISFYETHLQNFKGRVVHFSGALNDSRLLSAHPLMSFTSSLFAKDVYAQIHFAISGFADLQEALPGFKNSFSVLSAEDKSYYHALCVMAGNFPQLLWNSVSQEMRQLQIPTAGLNLYIRQVAENYIELKDKALTGPLVRGDLATIEKNLHSLEKSKKLQALYTAFMKEFSL